MTRLHRFVLLPAIVVGSWFVHPVAIAANITVAENDPQPALVMPGEFERQDAILLAWDETDPSAQTAQTDVVRAIWRKVPVILLVSSAEAQRSAARVLRQAGLPRRAVRYVRVAVDTVWARDYGPATVRTQIAPFGVEKRASLVNAEYERSERPNDDDIPLVLGPLLGMQTIEAALRIEGGNLLSNGAGLCITTRKVVDDNADRGYDEEQVAQLIKTAYGADEVLVLEPLVGEPTGHVDMFATFTAVNHVIVGQFSADDDPLNAEILDRNAQRLALVVTPRGPLNVVRIPMPPPEFETWRTYTNVLYANGTLLVPIYPGIDGRRRRHALAVYRQALPGWKIVGIDCSELIQSGGAIHCVTMNLSRVSRLPETTPLDGRPDPVRQIPYAEDDRVIVQSFDGELDEGRPLPDARDWPRTRRLASRAGKHLAGTGARRSPPMPDIVRTHGAGESRWNEYVRTPRRLRDYDRKTRISILRD